MHDDERFMRWALELAQSAASNGDLPFGCVIVKAGYIYGEGRGTGTDTDPTRHSELIAIREASMKIGCKLEGMTLYSTHEPCAMCCGGINHAKLSRVVYGSSRADLAFLFRQYHITVEDRLGDTSHPPEIGRVSLGLGIECVKLFEGREKLENGSISR